MANQKHLNSDQRQIIQEMIANHHKFTEIGKVLDKDH